MFNYKICLTLNLDFKSHKEIILVMLEYYLKKKGWQL